MGWSGITVEPVPAFAAKLREMRPRDQVVEAVITNDDNGTVTLHQISSTGLSTLMDEVGEGHRGAGWEVQDVQVVARRLDSVLEDAGWAGLDIHFMVIDTEGAERSVLDTLDLSRWRPWILVIEATKPLSTETSHEGWEELVLGAGYAFCFFDGLSRYYVSAEKKDELAPALAAPANPLDNYIPFQTRSAERQRDEALAEMHQHDEEQQSLILSWRSAALQAWAASAVAAQEEDLRHQLAQKDNHIRHVDAELAAIRRTLSWRITEPLRTFRTRGGRR